MDDKVEARLATLGITLPDAPNPVANYVPSCVSGNLLFISGQVSKAADGSIASGRLGGGMTVAEGRAAARLCALNILAQAKAAVGSLDRIAQILARALRDVGEECAGRVLQRERARALGADEGSADVKIGRASCRERV